MAIYLKYEGIDGEATHAKHEKWIDIGSLQFGLGRAISTPAGAAANREASEPSVSEVTVTKLLDSASSKLFTESATGAAGKKVEIHLVEEHHGIGPPANRLGEHAAFAVTDIAGR